MPRVLVVEDGKFFLSILTSKLKDAGFDVAAAASRAEAERRIAEYSGDIFLALLDLNLPDAPDGEIVDAIIDHGLPVVVYTGNFSEDVRDRVLSKKVIDYVVKEDPSSLDYLVRLITGLHRNRTIKALVVDDATSARHYTRDLLRQYQFHVVEAANGAEALDVIAREGDVRLMITDYHMPVMDGFQLIKEVRKTLGRERLAVIGVSSAGSSTLSARFIKSGANDFLNKPFLREEFFCRVQMNVDVLEHLGALQSEASKDYLTGVGNRRSFFAAAAPLLAAAQRGQAPIAVGLIDVDSFKDINDRHGHDVGDVVLARLAAILAEQVRRTDVLARFGGEEFCVLAFNLSAEDARQYFERLRQTVADAVVETARGDFRVTVSIGVCTGLRETIHQMISVADTCLYAAKRAGRNRIDIAE
ncbi:MAG: diguanylate cyclase [Magnetospirillum sp.]|nr:diguanylate cyclase [Magnetospirillum sp.]